MMSFLLLWVYMMSSDVICPYCSKSASLLTGKDIYPHRKDLWSLNFWSCSDCDAYVGCHAPNKGYGDGTRPLGRLANAELRNAKSAAHAAFDPLWACGEYSRKEAYKWLAKQLDIPVNETHIGFFDVSDCKRVVEVCKGI